MFETQSEGQQYIASLRTQLKPLQVRFEDLDHTPSFVRKRKGMEAEYQSLKSQIEALKEKIKQAALRYEEMMAMDEAQGASQRLGEGISKNMKLAMVGSGVLLVVLIVGAVIYKKVSK